MAALSSHSVSFHCIRPPIFCSLASMSTVSTVPSDIMRRGGIIRCSSQSSNISIQEPSTTYQFPSNVWEGYDFSSSSTDMVEQLEGRRQELKKEVKSMISHAANDPFQQIDLIDKIQRLGVAYHFETEIKHILETIYDNGTDFLHCADLYYTSTWFRLLRQAGHYASADVFNKFRDDEGRFHANVASDALSMLSLYQASYLSINGEDIMDEAMSFTTKHLNSMLPHLSPPLSLQVQNALKLPLHKSVERIEARRYISFYQQDQSRNETLLEFAKLDYNALQKLYRSEITILSSWWENLNMKSRLTYPVRDRVVEAYVINNSVFFEPQFSLGRIHLTKLWLIFTLIDDAHDTYGNLDELQLLDQAFQRWDDADLSELTGPLKHVFLESVNFVKEVEREMNEQGHFIGVPYMKKGLQDFARSQFEEVKYLFLEDLPILEKWFPIALRTVGFDTFAEIAAMHMGELATKEIFDWIASMPKLLTYTYYITRIVDDTSSYKRERDMGVNISTVTCYMKEHGVSELEAVENLSNMLSNLWKNMNRECLQLDFIPMCLLKAILNLSRTMEVFYNDGHDGFTTPKGQTEEIVTSLIINPICE